MRSPRSLRATFTWWFAATLVALYGIVATAVWLYARTSDRHYAILTLKAEAEVLAGYVTNTGHADAPEFNAPEITPFPIWFRLTQRARVLAATPGTPLPVRAPGKAMNDDTTTEWSPSVRRPYLVVRHAVGGPLQGATVEAIGSIASLVAAQQRLAAGLALAGLVIIPVAVLGGRWLAHRALRPVEGLVARIRALDSNRLGERLHVPARSVREVAILAEAFNELLDQLEASVERMKRFTSDASHEIRNPLSVLRTGLEVALRRPREADDYRTLLRENLQEIERLQAILEGLLALARPAPADAHALVKTAVDWSRLLEHTADAFGTVTDERGIRIEEDIEPGLIVEGDPQLLRLIIFNLLDNAIKHSPQGETVRIKAGARGSEVELFVADGGPGIAPESRDRLFRRFFRAPGTSPGIGGLGLSVVSWVTELHGGRVCLVDAERGATFMVALPRRAGVTTGIVDVPDLTPTTRDPTARA